jgi:TonB family protein
VHRTRTFAALLVFALSSLAQTVSNAGEVQVLALAKPVYPHRARIANVFGDVVVGVTIGSDGTVQSASMVSGHALLRQAALDSARGTQYRCDGCRNATPYQLVYSFRMIDGPDCCSAWRTEPQIEQEPLLSTPEEIRQAHIIITAQHSCLCDPAFTMTKKVRSLKCLYLWKCSVR